jgi:CheY-like chemotaxis protein
MRRSDTHVWPVSLHLRLGTYPYMLSAAQLATNPGAKEGALNLLSPNSCRKPSGIANATSRASPRLLSYGSIFNRLSIPVQGMTPEVLKRAMEPLFTTKEHGTGLGLATVYASVKRSGGFVEIHSVLAKGTTIDLYFPRADGGPKASQADSSADQAPPLGHGERILLVEDNDKVRSATESRLESLGYAVLEAKTGAEAIKLLESEEQVALVFSDIVMPGSMTGYDLAEWIRSKKPNLKVLLTTGYSDMPLSMSDALRRIRVLGKPYTREQLAHALHEGLNR